jgi:hypothetical protein
MTNDETITAKVQNDLAWARHHLFLLAAVAVLTIGSIYGIESVLAKRADQNFIAQKTILAQIEKQNEATQAQTKAQIDALTQQNTVLEQQFSAAMQAIAARDVQLLKDRGEIKNLPPTALATKWGASANEPAPAISANGDFDVPLPLAQKSYDALLQVPVLTKDNTDLKTAADQKSVEAANNEKKFEDEQKAHDSDKTACTQQVNTLNAEVTKVKADARKNNLLAVVFGVITGYLLHH